MLYTVEVPDAGEYLMEAQVATPHTSAFRIEVDNVNVSGRIGVPSTEDWGAYIWIPTSTVNLTEGRHKVKFYFKEGNLNVKALRFTKPHGRRGNVARYP